MSYLDQIEKIEYDTTENRGRFCCAAFIWLRAEGYGVSDVWTVTSFGRTAEEALENCQTKAVAKLLTMEDDPEKFWDDSNERAFRNLFRSAKAMQ